MKYTEDKNLPANQVIALYKANDWSSANKPEQLLNALQNSHSLVSAWEGNVLIGLGNAISDGFLVVYYPHLLVLPAYQGRGVGTEIMKIMMKKYADFHMHMLTADAKAIDFYRKCGFTQASQTEPMWIYSGADH